MKVGEILAVVILILVAVVALWGLLTYGEYLLPLPVRKLPWAGRAWNTLVIIGIGLLAGWISVRYLLRECEPPGGIWTSLAAGLGGAWLGGGLSWPGCWRWRDINVVASIVLAFVLAAGFGRLSACCYDWWKGRWTRLQ